MKKERQTEGLWRNIRGGCKTCGCVAESITEDIEMLGKARFVKIEDLKPLKQPTFDDVIIEMRKTGKPEMTEMVDELEKSVKHYREKKEMCL